MDSMVSRRIGLQEQDRLGEEDGLYSQRCQFSKSGHPVRLLPWRLRPIPNPDDLPVRSPIDLDLLPPAPPPPPPPPLTLSAEMWERASSGM
jgi:hypothetical protein